MKLQRIIAVTAVAAFTLSTLTACPWDNEEPGSSSSSSSSSSTRPSHDDDNDDSGDDDTSSSTPEEPEDNRKTVVDGDETYYIVTNEDGTTTYEVSGPKGLQAWAENSGSDCVLTGDIALTSGSWSPVQDFSGEFDGQGHTIKGLTSALFETVESSGTVKNVALDEVQIMGNQQRAGGVVRNYNSGTIMNCTVSGDISNNGVYAGGIVSYNNGTVIGCTVDGNVNADGGPDVYGKPTGRAGGIAASNNGRIVGCCFIGEVQENQGVLVGGITGTNYEDGSITSCYWSNPDNGAGENYNNSETAVTGGQVTGGWDEAIADMNAQLDGCEYVFALDKENQPKLVKKGSAEQAVSRLLEHFGR